MAESVSGEEAVGVRDGEVERVGDELVILSDLDAVGSWPPPRLPPAPATYPEQHHRKPNAGGSNRRRGGGRGGVAVGVGGRTIWCRAVGGGAVEGEASMGLGGATAMGRICREAAGGTSEQ